MTTQDKERLQKLIGVVVREARAKKNLTQVQTAEQTGISRSYLADVERGRYAPSVTTLVKLAICLDIDLNFLL